MTNVAPFMHYTQPPRRAPPAIHVSGKGDYDECPRKWVLGDRDWGFHWEPRFPPSALFIGGLVHDATFLYYHRGRDLMDAFTEVAQAEIDAIKARAPGEELWAEEREGLTKDLLLVEGMLKGYLKWQDENRGTWADSELEYLAMERSFHLWYQGVPIEGRIDGLARRKDTRELVVVEHKTCRSIDELKASLPWDLQPRLYAAAAEIMFGEPVPYVLYDMLQKTDPYNIPLLKNGLPSKAKSNVTTVPAYLETLQACMTSLKMSEEQREKVLEDYGDHLQWLLMNPANLYERWAYPIGKREKEFALEQMQHAYYRMREDYWKIQDGSWVTGVEAKLNRFRCPMMCRFKQVCAEMNRGGPWQALLDSGFVQGERSEYA